MTVIDRSLPGGRRQRRLSTLIRGLTVDADTALSAPAPLTLHSAGLQSTFRQ